MILNKDIIEKEKKKLTDKNIKIDTHPDKKKRDIYSSFSAIHFSGKIDFDLVELDGALAHEIIHIEEKHHIKSSLFVAFSFPLIAIAVMFVLRYTRITLSLSPSIGFIAIATFALEALLFANLRKHFERVADRKAAEKVGKLPIIHALEKVKTWEERDKHDLTHDRSERRIEALRRLNLPDFIELK